MGKLNKKIIIGLIFLLIGIFLGSNFTYAETKVLRVPVSFQSNDFKERSEGVYNNSIPSHWDPSWDVPMEELIKEAKGFIESVKDIKKDEFRGRVYSPDLVRHFRSAMELDDERASTVFRAIYYIDPEFAMEIMRSAKGFHSRKG